MTLSMLVLAAALPPSPDGVGTHTQLGLQPCQFLATTHIPCPTCGMTTATSYFVRGNILASLYIQPMGFLIALAAAVAFWAGLYIAVTGRPAYRLLRRLPTQRILFALLFFAILAWGWKILIHVKGMDGWH